MKLLENNPYQNWDETRKIGRWKYTCIHGIIFSVVIFVFNLVLIPFNALYKADFNFSGFVTFLFIALSMGVFGHYTLLWWTQEKLYHSKKKGDL